MEFVLLSLAAAGIAFVISSRLRTLRARLLRRMRRVPVARVANAGPGPIRLEGKARARGTLLVAPFSNEACIAYEIAVYRDANRTPFLAAAQAAEFFLEDDSGSALVQAGEVRLLCDYTASFVSGARGTSTVEAYLRAHGVEPSTDLETTLYCTETRISNLTHVVVCGLAKREVDPNPAHLTEYRATPTRLVVTSPNERPLLLADEASGRGRW